MLEFSNILINTQFQNSVFVVCCLKHKCAYGSTPFLFEELFELFGENLKDYLNFKPLDPWYRFYFHNGKTFDYRPSIDDTNNEIRKFDEDDVNGSKAATDIAQMRRN